MRIASPQPTPRSALRPFPARPQPARPVSTYAEKLTLSPGEMTQSDVEFLRAQAFTDRDITDAAHNIAFFSYINRMGEGLGVALEPFMAAGGESTAPGR